MSVERPPDGLCLGPTPSSWGVADLCYAAVSMVVAGHPTSSRTLLWRVPEVEPRQ